MEKILEKLQIKQTTGTLEEAGIDSLKLIEIISVLDEEYNIEIGLEEVLSLNQVSDLVTLIEQKM